MSCLYYYVAGVDVNKPGIALEFIMVIIVSLIAVVILTYLVPISMVYLIIVALVMILPLSYDIYKAYQNKDKEGKPTGIEGLARTLMAFGIILLLSAAVFIIVTTVTSNLRPLPTNLSSIGLSSAQNSSQAAGADKVIEIIAKNNDAIIETNAAIIEAFKTVLTILGGAISAIIGFYFGQKSKGCEKDGQSDNPQE